MNERRIHTRRAADAVRLRQVEGDESPSRTLVGHAAVFNQTVTIYEGRDYRYIETIRPGAFARALREAQDATANVDHDDSRLLGRTSSGTVRLSEDSIGLAVEIDVPETALGRDVLVLVDRRDYAGMSFAFTPARNGGVVTTITREGDVEVVHDEVLDVDLFDVAVVSHPAYPQTDVAARSKRLLADHHKAIRTAWVSQRKQQLEALAARAGLSQ